MEITGRYVTAVKDGRKFAYFLFRFIVLAYFSSSCLQKIHLLLLLVERRN